MKHNPDIPNDDSLDSGEFEPTPDALTIGAYYCFVDHGSVPGQDVRDWLETEAWLVNDSNLERRAQIPIA